MIMRAYSWMCVALVTTVVLTGCKPEIPLNSVPLTKALSGQGEAPCENLTFGGFPRAVAQQMVAPSGSKEKERPVATSFVCRAQYVLNYDTNRNISLWVIERVKSSNLRLPDQAQKGDETRADPALPVSKRSDQKDYVGIGYQKGFFAPPDDVLFSDIDYSHAYYTSNMFPQHPGQTATWRMLETWVRDRAMVANDVIVISGPLYANGVGLGWVGVNASKNSGMKSVNKGRVQVPTHTFKIVVDPREKTSIGFIIPNALLPSSSRLRSYVVSIAQIEQVSGLTFLSDLPQDEADRIKITLPSWASQGL